MKQLTLFTVFVCGLIGGINFTHAQDPYNDLLQNRPASKNLTAEGLKNLRTSNPIEFEKLHYLYTRSFDVEVLGCPSCQVDYLDLFNISLFDVTEFSTVRERDSNHEFDFKDKYHVTLHSEMQVLVNFNSIENSLAASKEMLSLPKLTLKNDFDTAYELYKTELTQFISAHPEAYNKMLMDDAVVKVSPGEFKLMNGPRQNTVLDNTQGYLIIE